MMQIINNTCILWHMRYVNYLIMNTNVRPPHLWVALSILMRLHVKHLSHEPSRTSCEASHTKRLSHEPSHTSCEASHTKCLSLHVTRLSHEPSRTSCEASFSVAKMTSSLPALTQLLNSVWFVCSHMSPQLNHGLRTLLVNAKPFVFPCPIP